MCQNDKFNCKPKEFCCLKVIFWFWFGVSSGVMTVGDMSIERSSVISKLCIVANTLASMT